MQYLELPRLARRIHMRQKQENLFERRIRSVPAPAFSRRLAAFGQNRIGTEPVVERLKRHLSEPPKKTMNRPNVRPLRNIWKPLGFFAAYFSSERMGLGLKTWHVQRLFDLGPLLSTFFTQPTSECIEQGVCPGCY